MKSNSSERLSELMNHFGITQTDISKKTGIPKSAMSMYVSGQRTPRQDRISDIAEAYGVNEAWLMGFDVPMKRDAYEDQNILRFDAELESACEVIQKAGYSLSFLDPPNDSILTVLDKQHNIVTYMHDYELVNKYEALLRGEKHLITAKSLLFNDENTQYTIDKISAFDFQLKALGWSYKIIFEPSSSNNKHGVATAIFQNSDLSFKASMDDCDTFINDVELFYKERLQQLLRKFKKQELMTSATAINAAHKRTDIETTEAMHQHDDDIMDDEDF